MADLKALLGAPNTLKGSLSGSLIPGPKGDKGEKGDKGDRGEKGDTGTQGPRGETGERGPIGETGAQGPQGEVGPAGPKGDTGAKGDTGERGATGPKGDTGEPGPKGDTGPAGPTGPQGLKGDKGDDYTLTDQDKEDIAGLVDIPVEDVRLKGASIVTDGVAELPIASGRSLGLVRIGTGLMVSSSGLVSLLPSDNDLIKSGISNSRSITPFTQHEATFYGLAKASGVDEKDSTLPVGEYTEDAKSAISEMLGGSVSVSGTTPTIVAKSGIRYVCGEVTTLDFTPPVSGICDVVFTSGATPTVLTVPDTIKWANNFDPTRLEANTTYEINVMDGLGVVGVWI